ncbi:hypothetical protein Tco_1305070, partial [Tanacetum coccineum]
VNFADMALPPREQRHPFLRYEGLQYTEPDIEDFETRLTRIYRREVHRVQVFDFGGLLDLMAGGLSGRMLMEHMDAQGVSLFTSRAWRRLFDIRRPLVHELILEFFSTFRFGQAISDLDTPGPLQFQLGGARRHISWREFILALELYNAEKMKIGSHLWDFLGYNPVLTYELGSDSFFSSIRLCHRLIACTIARRSQAPEKVTDVTDLFYLRGMDVDSVNVPYLLARYLRMFAAGRKSKDHIFGGQFVARLAEHFGLLTAEILGGLTVITPELPIIDMAELRQLDAAAGTTTTTNYCQDYATEDGQLEEDVHEIRGMLGEKHEVISAMARNFSRFCTWTTTSLARMMDKAGVTYTRYSETPREYTRHVRHKTSQASTSTAQQDPQQPDP